MKKRLLSSVSALALREWASAALVVLLCVPAAPPRAETGGAAVAAAPASMAGGAGEEGAAAGGQAEGPPANAEPAQPELGAETPPAWVLAHGPYTHWYPDRTQLVKNRATPGDETVWKDVIGTREFDTKGIAARWEGKVLHLAIFTNFPDRNVMAAGRPVAPADLALDLDGNGTLETGIVLTSVRSTGDRGVERPEGIRRAAAYRVTKWLRPDDILQHTYGQGWRWTGIAGQELAYAAVPVWVGAGTLRDDLAVTVDWRVNGRGSDHVVHVTLAMTGGEGGLENVPIIWGTGVCGNDVIFAPAAESGDLFKNLAEAQEAAEKTEDAGAAAAGSEEDAAFAEDAAFGTATTDEAADAGGGAEIVTEGISEGSDETSPTWNESYPVAFGGEGGGGGTTSGGAAPGGTATGGGDEESGGSVGSLSGGGAPGGGGGGGGGAAPGGEEGGGEPGGIELGGVTPGGGGEPENPLAPEGSGGGGGGGEETATGGGDPGGAVEITEPAAPMLLGSLLAGYLAFRTRRRRQGPGPGSGGKPAPGPRDGV